MKIVITGSAKEIADFAFLRQSQREVRRKPYTNETELLPVIMTPVQLAQTIALLNMAAAVFAGFATIEAASKKS